MDKIMEITGLKKYFGDVKAVDGINFSVERGTLFAFLGPNGAGKSTTIEMISTLLEPDAGEVTIDGYNLGKEDDKIRSLIGIVFQDNMLDDLLSVEENLMIRGSLYHKEREELKRAVEFAAKSTEVTEFIKRPYGKLSGGQKRRADMARALVNTPKLLILDEPTAGLDPQTRQYIWETLKQLKDENDLTIFLTTHYMEEAAKADDVVIIDKGRIIAQGTPAQLKDQYSSDYLSIQVANVKPIMSTIQEMGLTYEVHGDEVVAKLETTKQAIPIIEQLKEEILSFEVIKGTMDDAFINITGKEMRE